MRLVPRPSPLYARRAAKDMRQSHWLGRALTAEGKLDDLRRAVQAHLDTFGYDNHEGLADALVRTERSCRSVVDQMSLGITADQLDAARLVIDRGMANAEIPETLELHDFSRWAVRMARMLRAGAA